MGYTKRQLINASLEEIGLDPIGFDISSREYQRCARRLDALMASWKSKGIDLGYSVIASPEDIDIDAESNIADYGWQAVFLNLAISIAPTFGKQPLNETKANAKSAYMSLLNTKIDIKKYAYPQTFPKGAGNKPFHTNQDNYFSGTGTTSTSSATSTTVITDYLDGVFKKNDVIIGKQGGVDAKLTLNTTPVDGVGSDILFGFDAVTGENKLINPKIDLITNAQTGTFEKDDIIFAEQGGVSKKLSINSTPVDAVNTDKLFAFDGSTNESKVVTPTIEMLAGYETGTWTPVFKFVSAPTYTEQTGRYTKIGNVFYFDLRIKVSAIDNTDTSVIHIGGVPYNSANERFISGTLNPNNSSLISSYLGATDALYVTQFNSTAVIALQNGDGYEVKYTDCNTSGNISITGWYFV